MSRSPATGAGEDECIGVGAIPRIDASETRTVAPPDLLRRVALRDERAMQECIDVYGGLVWSLARRFCPTSVEAEDATQEIFIDVWKSAKRYQTSLGSQDTFVAMIARRRLIDRHRRRGARHKVTGIDALPEIVESPPDAPSSTNEDARIALHALQSLSKAQRDTVYLSVLHGMSHDQIARQTGMPLGTVKTHIRRGLMAVRKQLTEQATE